MKKMVSQSEPVKKKKIASKTEPEQNGNGKPVRTLIQ